MWKYLVGIWKEKFYKKRSERKEIYTQEDLIHELYFIMEPSNFLYNPRFFAFHCVTRSDKNGDSDKSKAI